MNRDATVPVSIDGTTGAQTMTTTDGTTKAHTIKAIFHTETTTLIKDYMTDGRPYKTDMHSTTSSLTCRANIPDFSHKTETTVKTTIVIRSSLSFCPILIYRISLS